MEKVKVGVVGTGHLGRFHALNYAEIESADLVGVFDTDMVKAQKIAQESGSKTFDSLDSLFDEIDAISLAVPTDFHHPIGKTILEKGIHCLIEKPIAKDLKEADDLIRIAEEKKVILQVGHVERFNPAMRALTGFDIHPQFIESHRLAPFNPRGTEVAVVLDLMIHDIEIILDLVKSPVALVDASGVAVVSDTVDIANARLRFENGSVANLTTSRISQKKMRKMRMFQKDAYITVDFLERVSEIFHLDEKSDQGMVLGEIGVGDRKKKIFYHKPEVPEALGLKKELEAFVQTVAGHETTAVSGQSARDALAVAIKVLEKIESGSQRV